MRVPFQRRHASPFTGRHVPHLDRLVVRRRHDAPPVRKHGNTIDLRRRQIITKVQRTPQRTPAKCPCSVATHSPVATSHTLSVLSFDADMTRCPSGNTATPKTYDEDTSTQKILQKADAAQRTVPECPCSVTHSPVATSHTLSMLPSDPDTKRRPSGNTATLKTYDEDTSTQKALQTADAAQRTRECALSVATHSPVATSHTLSVPSHDPDTMRRPSGNTAAQRTYNEDTLHKSTTKFGRRVPHGFLVPSQRPH
jgi:hypothetical protein